MQEGTEQPGPPQEDEKKYLTKDQVKTLLDRLDLTNQVLVKLLYNGISLREIGHIRAKDIRPVRENGLLIAGTIKLVDPKRKIYIDAGTYNKCIQLINGLNLGRSPKKIFKIQYRRIEQIVKQMGKDYLGITFLTPKVLNNTFWILRLSDPAYKSWTWEDYQFHLGWVKKDYTIQQLEYFKTKIQEIEKGDTNGKK